MIRLRQRPLFGFLADPFGGSARAMELDGDHLRITRRGEVTSMSLQSLASAPSLRKGMLGTALTISSGDQHNITLKGAGHHDAHDFSEAVKTTWTRYNLAALEKEAARLDRILAGVRTLASPSRYPAACQIAPLLDDARALDASLLSKLNAEAIGPETAARIAPVRKFAGDPQTLRANGIAAFVSAELDRWKDFFDTIEDNPLTPEQRLSVVVDEDATLVLAGAGSGKPGAVQTMAAATTHHVHILEMNGRSYRLAQSQARKSA